MLYVMLGNYYLSLFAKADLAPALAGEEGHKWMRSSTICFDSAARYIVLRQSDPNLL
jgi:hypothetical protein